MSQADHGLKLIGASLGSAASATIFGLARWYCNKHFHGRVYFEDWVLFVTVVLLWAGATLITISVRHGLGRHWVTLDADERFYSRFYYVLGIWPAIMAIGVPKLAIVGLIVRVFSPPPMFRALLWSTVVLGLLNHLTVCLYSTFLCLPVQAFWDDSIKNAKCISPAPYADFAYYTSTYSAVVDLYLALYPVVIFRGLNFSRQKKIGLSCALGLGVFATGIAAVKISYQWVLEGTNDFTWDMMELVLWTFVESAVITVAASIPVLHPLWGMARDSVQKIRSSLGGSHQVLTESYAGQGTETTARKTPIKEGHWTRMINQVFTFGTFKTHVDTRVHQPPASTSDAVRDKDHGGKETTIATDIELISGVTCVAEPKSVKMPIRYSRMPV